MTEALGRRRVAKGVREGGRFATEHKSEAIGLGLAQAGPARPSALYAESLSRALNRSVSADPAHPWMDQARMSRQITAFLNGACGSQEVDPDALARQTWITMTVDTGTTAEQAGALWDRDHARDSLMLRTRRAVGRALESVHVPAVGGPASAGIVDTLPWPVPDLSAEQQRATGLPADFTAAFNTHFAEAAEMLDRHAGRTEDATQELNARRDAALARLAKSFEISEAIHTDLPATPGRFDPRAGWVLQDSGTGVTTIAYRSWRESQWDGGYWEEGPSLSSKSRSAATHAGQARSAERSAGRIELLADIRAGLAAPWNFLPSTFRQDRRARNVAGAIEGEMRQIEARERSRRQAGRYPQDRQQHSGRSHTAEQDEIRRAELEEQSRYYRQSAGWPGGDLSPQQRLDGSWAFLTLHGDGDGSRDWGWQALPG